MKRSSAALIDEARCIGCRRCIDACPVDAIVGAEGFMHTVVEPWCIGCALCAPACPVDCIDMVAPRGQWSDELKAAAARRARSRRKRFAVSYKTRTAEERRAVLARLLGKKTA